MQRWFDVHQRPLGDAEKLSRAVRKIQSNDQENKSLPRHNPSIYLADLVAGLGILIIGG
jgi:hypothetical protein